MTMTNRPDVTDHDRAWMSSLTLLLAASSAEPAPHAKRRQWRKGDSAEALSNYMTRCHARDPQLVAKRQTCEHT